MALRTYLDFVKEVNSSKIKPAYLISAYDNYFVSKAAELLKEKLFGSKDNNNNYFLKYADETKYNEILDLCSNFTSIFSPRILVIVKRCEKLGKSLQQILSYTEKPCEDTTALFVFDKEYVTGKKLYKEFDFYEFSDLPKEHYLQWLKDEFKKRNCVIEDSELQLFASSFSFNYEIAEREIEKISNYFSGDDEKIISQDIILNLTGFDRTFTPDDLILSILNKDKKRTMHIADYLLNKMEINEGYLLSIISNYYADLLCFKTRGFSDKNSYDTYRKYKIWKSRFDFAKVYHNKISVNDFDKAFSNMLETDRKIKSSTIDPKILMTSLIEDLMQ